MHTQSTGFWFSQSSTNPWHCTMIFRMPVNMKFRFQLVSNKRYKRTSWAGVNLDSPLSVSEFVLGSASISMGCSVVISCSNTGDGGRSMRCAGLNGRSLSIHRRRRSTAAREYSSSLGWLSIFLVVDRGNADTATMEIHSRKKTSTISRRPTILSHDRPVPRTV